MKTSKFKLIFLLVFSIILSDIAFAGTGNIGINNGKNIKQDIKIYYVEDLKSIGYDIGERRYENINSDQKEKITTKLQAYLYKEGIRPVLEIKDATTTDNLFSPDKHGFYLLVLDKKNYEGKVLESKPVLIYYNGSYQMINIKSELEVSEDLMDLEVVLHWFGRVLDNEVWIGLHDEEGNLIDEAWLTSDNNWRHMFFGLDPMKNYSIWVETIDGVFFTMSRVGNTIYIDNYPIEGPEDIPDDVWWPDVDVPDFPIIPGGSIIDSKEDEDIVIDDKEDLDQEAPDSGEVPGQDQVQDQSQGDDLLDMEGHDTDEFRPEADRHGDKLPQTGLLWWPVPILLALAIFFFVLSFRREDND